MKRSRRLATILAISIGASSLSGMAAAQEGFSGVALMRLDLERPVREVPFPVHSVLQDAAGVDYALILAPVAGGLAAGARIVDPEAAGADYLVALERRPGARNAAAVLLPVLLDDGLRIVVRDAPGRADRLAEMGFDLGLFSRQPWVFPSPAALPASPQVTYDSRVATIMAAVTQAAVYGYNGNLSGENPVIVDDEPYTIVTRHTSSGVPIQKATQYVYEFMSQFNLDVSFHNWGSGRNVIGEKLGATDPDEIVLITAHLDDMPSGGLAPGADDNGSGSVGVMLAAELLDPYWFKKTVRFVFFTGEEQGLLGSQAYAAKVQADGDTIVAVYNMDMIAYDSDVYPLDPDPTLRIHTRPGNADDLAIANTFGDVVSIYGLSGDLSPIIDPDGISASDHASFWSRGYPAVLAIEDDQDDFNAYYHSVDDTRDNLNMGYFTSYVKASLGTAAHLAVPTVAPCAQNMDPLAVDVDIFASSSTSSNLNGVLERGERVMVSPTWEFPVSCAPSFVTGQVVSFTAPGGMAVSKPDDGASYGFMSPGEIVNCHDEGNCYELWVSAIGTRPATHVDLLASEELSVNRDAAWVLHLGESFTDVPQDHWAYSYVETILHHGITAGWTETTYAPLLPVKRWHMATFLTRAMLDNGPVPTTGTVPDRGDYDCTPGGTSVFSDVPPGSSMCPAVHYIASQEVTLGCGGTSFCPYNPVTRRQMAAFLARVMTGAEPIPPSGTVPGWGSYDCSPGGTSVFSDISPTNWACPAIHYIAAEAVTEGCGGTEFCPDTDVTRAQMAAFLMRAFELTLYGP